MPRDKKAERRHFNSRPGNTGSLYVPTETGRLRVRRLAMLGVGHREIARNLGVDPKTLRKHFERELEEGNVEAFASVAGALWNNAVKHNNVVAQIFWMKARHGWVDRREVNHNHTLGPQLSHEERLALLEADPPNPDDPHQRTEIIDGVIVPVGDDDGSE